MAEDKKTVAVDLDGTLAEYHEWEGVDKIGRPLHTAQAFCQALIDMGFRVVIYTTRTNALVNVEELPDYCKGVSEFIPVDWLAQKIEVWLEAHDFPPEVEVYTESGKPLAIAYVDDRAVACDMQCGLHHGTMAVPYLMALNEVERLAEK